MSQNDKEFAAINIEIDERRPTGQAKKASSAASSSNKASSNNVFVSAVFVIALAACAGSAYLYTQLQISRTEAQRTEQRLLALEDKLSATGEEMGNSTVALQVKVTELSNKSKELWDQMDKLWASAWRRNQEEIKTLDKDVTGFKSDVNTLIKNVDKKVSDAQSSSQQMLSRVNGLNDKLNNQANDILAASVSAEQATQTAMNQSKEVQALNEKVLLLEKRNTALLNKISDLETQLRELATKTVSTQVTYLGGTEQHTAD